MKLDTYTSDNDSPKTLEMVHHQHGFEDSHRSY